MVTAVKYTAEDLDDIAGFIVQHPLALRGLLARILRLQPELREYMAREIHCAADSSALSSYGPPESVAPLNVLTLGFGGW